MSDVVTASEPTGSSEAASLGPSAPGSVAVVVNPTKVDDIDALAAAVAERCEELGLPKPWVLTTTEDDPGIGQTREAVAGGARVVLAAGGDGTVRAVAEALVGTGVALGVVPQGTGNLLARNLDLPTDEATALDVALSGADRTLDVGRLGDGTVFAVMAGAGFDAAMMRDAPDGLKKVVGWPAYIVGGARSLRRHRVSIRVRLDGGPWITDRVRTVLIGNLGKLQGGLELLPDAEPDDGVLDVALVAPRRALDWVVLLSRGLTRRSRPDRRMRTFRARRVEVRLARPQPRQVDGDVVATGDCLDVDVVPASLVVRVPRGETAR
jgi:diacylglycerol kinase family enzyme